MMSATLMGLKNSVLGNIFILLCTAYGFVFVIVLILLVLHRTGYLRKQWGRKSRAWAKSMFFFGGKFFLSGFFGIFVIGQSLNAYFKSADDNLCGVLGITIVVLVWLLYQLFGVARIIIVAAMCVVLIVLFAVQYLPNAGRSSISAASGSSQVSSAGTAQPRSTSQASGTVRIFSSVRPLAEALRKNKNVKVAPRYKIRPLYDQTKAVKGGAIIPIKIELCDAGGTNVSASSIVVTATTLSQVSNSSPGVLEDGGNAPPDDNFRYLATLGQHGGYIFNLKTTGLSTGTYSLSFAAGSDPTVYNVLFQVK